VRQRGRPAISSVAASALFASVIFVRPVLAESPAPVGRAEALFVAGKALLERHEYVRACPLLKDSFDLDPGTGALLALAICFEGQGKLASAAAAYQTVAARAAEEQRADRVQVARNRGDALNEQLSTITIVPPADGSLPAGFNIRRDGAPVDAAQLAVPLPFDGGEHVIDASATGKRTWSTRVWLATAGDRRIVTVPTLEDAVAEAPGREMASSVQSAAPMLATTMKPANTLATTARENPQSLVHVSTTDRTTERQPTGARLRLAGIGLMGAGAVALGVGAFYGIRAMNQEEASQRGCTGNVCSPQGKSDRLAAMSAGNSATAAFVAGGILAAAGGVLFIVGHHQPSVQLGNLAVLRGALALNPGGAGLVLEGTILP
jgi:hypothetical protein